MPFDLPVFSEPQCSPKCRSLTHASQIMSAITKGSETEVMSYLKWICFNYAHLIDEEGRTALHFAASCGKWQVIRWLLNKKHGVRDCNGKDYESGWTSLHRSLFYGQLTAAKSLQEHGASLSKLDNEGLSPLDLVMKDRPRHLHYGTSGIYEVYVWGLNSNYNLGFGFGESPPYPELLETFRKENVSISKVVLCKFHSVFLANNGTVFTCGHGHGGRLGHSVEKTVLTPQKVKSVSKETFVDIAAATDHTVLLTESGTVWTFGSNTFHQLGHEPPSDSLLIPRRIVSLRGHKIRGVCAARFHTVAYSKEEVFTFGLNAGQLGHPEFGDRFQTAPKIVRALNLGSQLEIRHVAACDGATICVTNSGDIYVLHEYLCRKIASKQWDVVAVAAHGGNLDTKANSTILKEGGGSELRILTVTKTGKIFLWTGGHPQLTRCLLSVSRQLHINSVALFNTGVLFTTEDGEAFTGSVVAPKLSFKTHDKGAGHNRSFNLNKHSEKGFACMVERDECFLVKINRLPNIYRATVAACDKNGRNFAVLQAHPKCGLLEIPQLSASEIDLQIGHLLQEADLFDSIHDAVIKVGPQEFAVHKYILTSRCRFFRDEFLKGGNHSANKKDNLNISSTNPAIVQQILEFLYSDTCKLLTNGQAFYFQTSSLAQPDLIVSTLKDTRNPFRTASASRSTSAGSTSSSKTETSPANPVKLLQEAAKKFDIPALTKRLENVQFKDGRVVVVDRLPVGKPVFDRKKFPELYDVIIKAEDGLIIKCHKCILVARSEYFRSMLASNWAETSTLSSLMLPIPGAILEIVIDCLYTDEAAKLAVCEDVEFLCNVLVMADRLLLTRLKELSEIRLADHLTLKNAAELLEFSFIYNADQLKAVSMQFIGLNLPAFLESKSLFILSDEVLVDLTNTYRQMIPQMSHRVVTPYADGPSRDEIESILKMFPVHPAEGGGDNDDEEDGARWISPTSKEGTSGKKKAKRRPQARRSTGMSEDASSTSSRMRNESTCSLESSVLSDSDFHQEADLEKSVSDPVDVPGKRLQESGGHSLTSSCTLSSSFQSPPTFDSFSSPPLSATFLVSTENVAAEFPDLLSELQRKKESTPIGPKSSNFRRCPKLSQKQRKKMAAEHVISAPKPIPPALFAEKLGQPSNPWRNLASSSPPQSLKEIMNSEEKAMSFGKLVTLTKNQNKPLVQSPPPCPVISISPKTAQNAWGDRQQVGLSPLGSLPKGSPVVPCLADTMKLEQEHFDYLSRMQNKPLHLIQKEDEAIEALLIYYRAHDNPDEHITVERVLMQVPATPIWKPSK